MAALWLYLSPLFAVGDAFFMAVTFNNENTDRAALEKFYRSGAGDAPWRQTDEEFLRDPLNALRIELLEKKLAELAPESLLDVGCGSGILARRFAAARPDAFVAGCDLSPNPNSEPGAVFTAGDAVALPFRDGAFRCVVCSETLEHLPDPASALREFRRVLAPGGDLLITVPNLFCFDSIEGKLHAIEAVGKALSRARITSKFKNGINTHIQKLPPSRWQTLLNGSGYIIASHQPIRAFPYIPYFISPLKTLENRLFSTAPALAAQSRIDRALKKIPAGQLHFFHCK